MKTEHDSHLRSTGSPRTVAASSAATGRSPSRATRQHAMHGGHDSGQPSLLAADAAVAEDSVREDLAHSHGGKISGLAISAANIAVAGIALVLLAPVWLLSALAIRIDSHGPILYRQVRVGLDRRGARRAPPEGRRAGDRGLELEDTAYGGQERRRRARSESSRRSVDIGGRPFLIYKFRTMRVNAEEQTGPVWAAARDPRTTRVGRVLRRYRLDEIPQFLNVLKGDMSVVGPRPERPDFVRHLRRHFRSYSLRQRVKPGITGLAQVSQGADQSLDDVGRKLAFDLEYLRRRSLSTDLRIMLKTLPVMLFEDHQETLEAADAGAEQG